VSLRHWLGAFLMTQGIEAPLYMRFGGLRFGPALLPSLLTHPVVWFAFFHPAVPLSWFEKLVAAETFACLAEAVVLRLLCPKRPLGHALLLSLLVNGASLGAGLLSTRLFGFP
jgi:hypothetical protein